MRAGVATATAIAWLAFSMSAQADEDDYKQRIMITLAKCWAVPEEQLKSHEPVVVAASFRKDTTLEHVGIRPMDRKRYKSDPDFKLAADSAMNAVKDCSPLNFLPKERYSEWKDMLLTFDPKMNLLSLQ